MFTFSSLIAAFVVSIVLSVPLAYVLVSIFKFRVERKINSYNDFEEISIKPKMIGNSSPAPDFRMIKEFPISVKGFSLIRELPMLAGIVLSALLANYYSFPVTSELDISKFLVYYILAIAPIVYYLYYLFEHRSRYRKILKYVLLLLIVLLLIYAFTKTDKPLQATLGLLYFYGASSILVFIGFVFKRIREIIYAILPPVYLAMLSFWFLITLFSNNMTALKALHHPIYEILNVFGLADYSAATAMLVVYVFFFIFTLLILFVSRYAYMKKWYNNAIFLFDVLWLFHLSFIISLGERPDFWVWVLATFFIYKFTFYLLSFLLQSHWRLNDKKSLLVLRVFSLNKESAFMFRKLRSFWRYQGPIHLIAGYDLTATTIDVDDLLMFISGKLKRRFNLSMSLIAKNVKELDEEADLNGHFRVNEMYCNNATWQTVVDILVKKVDFVLMDIRSFSKQNAGCAHEIQELVHKVHLDKVCFIVDRRTDIEYTKQCIIEAWHLMPENSPNLNAPVDTNILLYNHTSQLGLSKFLS